MRLKWSICVVVLALVSASSMADVEEIFSRHVRILRPRGEFASQLIRLTPGGGAEWKKVGGSDLGLQLAVPADAKINDKAEGSRILEVSLPSTTVRPAPVLRVDRFAPEDGDPTVVDREYAETYAKEYSQTAFQGKFTVSDSGLIVKDRKTSFAMVGGAYALGAVAAHRVQWTYVDANTQLFVTFDCSEREWPKFSDQVGRSLLSLEIIRPKSK